MAVHALKARYIFPISSRPIADGMVGIQGRRIVAVDKHLAADKVEDLGHVAILPGLVNAHTHLEFSDLKKPLGRPGIGFVDWLRLVIEHRRAAGEINISALKKGFNECAHCGVTTIGDIAQSNFLSTELINENLPIDGTIFLELIAPTADRIAPALELAQTWQNNPKGSGFRVQGSEYGPKQNPESRTLNPEPLNWQLGLSPHAPYSVHEDLLQKIVTLSVRLQIPLAMHLAESCEEIEYLSDSTGPFKNLLDDLGANDPSARSPGSRPLDYLQMLAVASRVLIIHGNYLSHDEIGLLADHAESMAVVFCPRTHDFFRHDRYPLEQMLAAGVTVCLGTDSRASAPDLDLLAEIRFVARKYPEIPPQIVLELGTLQGARALGREPQIGTLEPRKFANFAIVPLPENKTTDPHELLFESDLPVAATWFHGKMV